MANSTPFDGTNFLPDAPDQAQPHGNDFREHQSTRKSMQLVNNKEHETIATDPSASSGGGVHLNGSSVAYEGTTTPVNRPDGSTALADNAIDRGRTWFDYGTTSRARGMKIWNGSSWEYIGDSSGSTKSYAGAIAPSGWLLCDGDTDLSVTANPEYAGLFSVIGITYGGVDLNNFDLPDLRGYFVRGLSTDNLVDPDTRALGDIQADGIITHKHITNQSAAAGSGTVNVGRFDQTAEGTDGYNTSGPTAIGDDTFIGLTETRPKNIALNYIIKI